MHIPEETKQTDWLGCIGHHYIPQKYFSSRYYRDRHFERNANIYSNTFEKAVGFPSGIKQCETWGLNWAKTFIYGRKNPVFYSSKIKFWCLGKFRTWNNFSVPISEMHLSHLCSHFLLYKTFIYWWCISLNSPLWILHCLFYSMYNLQFNITVNVKYIVFSLNRI